MMYGSWDIGHNRFFFFISGYFLPFYHPPLTTQKIKILEKWKKLLEVLLLILNMSTINENYMMYAVWDTEHERQIFFSFWTIFCPFTPHSPPLITQRIKIFKKWKKKKKTWRYHHFTQVYYKWQSYDIWFLRYEVHQTNFFSHLGHLSFFALLPA